MKLIAGVAGVAALLKAAPVAFAAGNHGAHDGLANAQIPLQVAANNNNTQAYSPPHYPSPWMNPKAEGWEAAYAKAREFVSQMTLLEKVNLTTGTG